MNKKIAETVNYIIRFLLQGNDNLASLVGYTSDKADFHRYKIIIEPSGFFDTDTYGTMGSYPSLPLAKIEGLELLFGSPSVDRCGDRLLVKADIVASSFFLLSRYEEFVCPSKLDVHGRFEGRESLPFRAGFINRPLVDEYGKLLRNWLRSVGENPIEPPKTISKVYLTHDVDSLGLFQTPDTALRGLYRAVFQKERNPFEVIRAFGKIDNDPAYTFHWLVNKNRNVHHANQIFFFKSLIHSKGYDKPHYSINKTKVKQLLDYLQQQGCDIGLHSSYYSTNKPHTITYQNLRLAETLDKPIRLHRSHYLTILPPNMPHFYTDVGITDDFTLGYASIAGFRLGTCRAVHWINPKDLSISKILLHPLTLMDGTLSNSSYMGLSYDEALSHSIKLLQQVEQHNGEAVLLWHNTSVTESKNSYHSKLYEKILIFLS